MTLLCLILTIQPCIAYSGVSYSGQLYYGITIEGISYSGDFYSPVTINGVEVLPISVCGTTYDGEYYKGMALSEIKVSQITISGNETSDSLYQKDVSEEYRAVWKSVITKFAVGTSVIVVTGVLTLITGGQVGYICAASFSGALGGAASGALFGAIIQGTLSALKGSTSEQIFYEMLSGAADGYMWGAITGAITGAVSGANQLKKGTAVLNSKGKVSALVNDCGDVLDPKTGEIIGYGASKSTKGEYLYYLDRNYIYRDFDGKQLNLRRLGDMVLNGTNTKTASLYGMIDDVDDAIYLGDDAIGYLNSHWDSIKSNTSFFDLTDEIVYDGTISHPKTLGINLEKAMGSKIPENASRHHIVPWNESDENAVISRQILKRFNVDIDSAYNGVALPQGAQAQAEALGMAYHRTLHTAQYYQEVQLELSACQTRDQVIEVLNDIRKALLSNDLFWL